MKQRELIDNVLDEIKAQLVEVKGMANSTQGKEILSVEEASQFLGVSIRTLQNYRDRKLIPYSQYDRKIWFKKTDLINFLDSCRIERSIA